MDDISDIQAFYDRSISEEQGRLDRHQLERDITWRYFDEYLPPSGKILEIGAAAGAYTIPLAKRGYTITAVDLSPKLLEICRKRAAEEGLEKSITCVVADARGLSMVHENEYDVVLMMGPLYHLVLEEDRKKALGEADDRLKPDGKIFSTFVSRYGIWADVMKKLPHYIERQTDLKSVLEKGRDADIEYWKGNFRGYFASTNEIIPLHEAIGFTKLVLAGLEPAGTGADETYNNLQGERRKLWLDLFFSISTQPSIIGASSHVLYIGKKQL